MKVTPRIRAWFGCVAATVAGASLITWLASCGSAPTAFPVVGPPVTGNALPSLTVLEPANDITLGQGDNFLIRWSDSDQDSNADISFLLVNTDTNAATTLVDGIKENDTGSNSGPDSFTAGTSLVPLGVYNLLGIIDDHINEPVTVFATANQNNGQERVVITIVEPGSQPPTVPPTIAVTQPDINFSVAQDDLLRVTIQPTTQAPNANMPYDSDSNVTVYILLDTDLNPNNDNPASPEDGKIILLRQQTIVEDTSGAIDFKIPVDLAEVPPLPGGEPYYVRATIDDLTNPRVHNYAPGTINVVGLAAGLVDLAEVGTTKSGARFLGFNPGAHVGSNGTAIGDFDADNVPDFVIVGQFGNPRNFGAVGEAYLIYGKESFRFGGTIQVNTVGDRLAGTIFEAPPVRLDPDGIAIPGLAYTNGITSVNFVRDLTGDNRPELLFGLSRVYGAVETMDFDPGDDDLGAQENEIMIEIVARQGQVTVQTGDGDPVVTNPTYNGVDDTTIKSDFPNTAFGSDQDLSWRDGGTGQRSWTLLKFKDILEEIPDAAPTIDFTSLMATIEFRVFRTGVDGTLYQDLTDFDEQTTYANFARDGGEPEANTDYVATDAGGLDMIAGDAAEVVEVDVTDVVRQLLDRDLTSVDNELRFIIVPNTDNDNAGETAARSSEFSFDRPTLHIQYTQRNISGAIGCYPDDLPNNLTDEPDDQKGADTYYFSGGMAVLMNSQNRDNDGIINPARMDKTSVALELVGQEAGIVLDAGGFNPVGGDLFARADNEFAEPIGNDVAEPGRIAGARFNAGPFDFIDHRRLRQGPREDLFGQKVASIGDLNNDGIDEIIISAPTNERHLEDLLDANGLQSTHLTSTLYPGSLTVIPGHNYNAAFWRDKTGGDVSTTTIPNLDQHRIPPFGQCTNPRRPRHMDTPLDSFAVFAENVNDRLGDGQSAGDFNLDGIDDILCGGPQNDRSSSLTDTGAAYILYGRTLLGDFVLANANNQLLRAPMIRIRGEKVGDQIGWKQATGLDVNGDRIDDVFISSPRTDYGNINRTTCAGDYDNNGSVNSDDLKLANFNSCFTKYSAIAPDEQLFSDNPCKAFDYDNDGDVQEDDRCVFCCLSDDCDPADTCSFGTQAGNCCANLVDNGFVGVIFGGVFTDGDRDISQLATTDLAGTIFFGTHAGDQAGFDVSSAGDFNEDGFGDLMIAVPGETRLDTAGRERLGVVYIVFGGTHLTNTIWDLAQVGSEDLPGIVFLSPYVKGAPNEAAPKSVAFIGDINRDGFGDIEIGIPEADFIDQSFPQGPEAPNSDAAVGRRSNAGNAYVVYGNNFGTNRGSP